MKPSQNNYSFIDSQFKFSALLRFEVIRPFLRYMNELVSKLAYKKEKAL